VEALMSLLKQLFVATVALLLFAERPSFAAPAQAATSAAKHINCWRLEQKNILLGDCVVYASPTAIKVVFKNGKWVDIARAPDWELFVVNPDQKIFCRTTIDKWKINSVKLTAVVTNSGTTKVVKTGLRGRICGLPAFELKPNDVSVKPGEGSANSFWVAQDLVMPEAICHIMCCNSFLPQLHAVPLRVRANVSVGSYLLDTTLVRQLDVQPTFFDLPPGLKETKNPEDIMNSGVMDVVKDMTGM